MIGSILKILGAISGVPKMFATWWRNQREKRLEKKLVKTENKLREQEKNAKAQLDALKAAHKIENERPSISDIIKDLKDGKSD